MATLAASKILVISNNVEVTSVVVRDSIPSAFEQTPRSPRKRLLLVKLCSQHKNGSRVNAIRLHKAPTHAIVNWV